MRFFITLILSFTLFNAGAQEAVASDMMKEDATTLNQQQLDILHRGTKSFPEKTQLAIAVVNNGKVSFAGIERVGDTIKMIDNHDHTFEIGSLTKVFTSTLLADLVLNDKIKLDDPLEKHMDYDLSINPKTTLKQLANHTSGLPRLPTNLNLFLVDQSNPYKEYDSSMLKQYLTSGNTQQKQIGTSYEYSNLGAGTLGFVLASMEQMTYEELLQECIFNKYNMSNSTTLKEKIKTELIEGRDDNGNITSNWDFDALAGAGAILSTVEDLSKFALAQFDKTNESLALTQESTYNVNSNMDIGLGWHIIKRIDQNDKLWHNGGTGGYSSSMVLDVTDKSGVIILSNLSAFHPKMGNIDGLSFGLLKTLADPK
ncbi:serine hydrolase domain-containing protein [Nonlabens ponticola]|uniref:Class A beta-lactamase-related serine hydrolase n=1 Tax=Nonlabens ponticola TaxID=2496866 RepID=A0A3S9N0B0_9FLAO|nr:serine hydrolase domain-containing protein [Nonlabens ponticola]AZQ44814.1 class A beta-lactamase-related serine hydrolase [Nonlabens ponticola]